MHALIVMPCPLSVSQKTIIIVLYYSVQSEVSAVRKPESPLVGSFFLYSNIGKSIRTWSCVRYRSPLFGASVKTELTVVTFLKHHLNFQIESLYTGADPEIEEGGGAHIDWGLVRPCGTHSYLACITESIGMG